MSLRRPLIVGNWKMFHGGPSACALAGEVAREALQAPGVDVVVCPPFTALAAVAAELDGFLVGLGAQNLHVRPSGAYTGEVSGPMLVECGARWVIVGHSERRLLAGETDELVAAKTAAALEVNLMPIVCVGETLHERNDGQAFTVVRRQLEAVMPLLDRAPGRVSIAYEPVWAIGTGLNATPAQAQEVHASLRALIAQHSTTLADQTRILYGGSVRPDNASALLGAPDIDGALVGGASLDAQQFLAIVKAAQPSLPPLVRLPRPCSTSCSPSFTSPPPSSSSWWCSSSKGRAAAWARSAGPRPSRSSAAAARATC